MTRKKGEKMKFNIDLLNYFSRDELNSMARETKFVKRESPINGFNFALTFTVGSLNTTNPTLKQLTSYLNNNFNTNISPQAIDERINKYAVEFLKKCFNKAIELSVKKIDLHSEMFSYFSHIYIIDSTNFNLHPSLKEEFKGSSGHSSDAMMRIQFVYDYLTGQFYIEIGDIKTADASTLFDIVKNSKLNTSGTVLYLQDLGYFKTETFISISERSDFFISKLKFNIDIKNIHGNKININELLKKKPNTINIVVTIGNLKCRLVGSKLKKKDAIQRIKDAEKEAKKKGRNPISRKYKLFLKYGLFITNLSKEYSPKAIYIIYRLRWQVELIFKSWKSILEIHKIHSAKKERILCEVYGKLIIAVILMNIHYQIKHRSKAILSFYQVFQYIKTVATNWTLEIVSGIFSHSKFLKKISIELQRFCIKSKQKTRERIEDLLSSINKKKHSTKYKKRICLA
jgi:hypothetical protein